MKSSALCRFSSVWVIDTEFRPVDGGLNQPVCLCALDLVTGQRLEHFFDREQPNPFNYTNSLFVAFTAAAEWETFISLGWDLPHYVLDLYFEYLNQINGLWYGDVNLKKMGCGLTNAMAAFNLDGLSQQEKDEEREHILSQTSYPPDAQRRILDYCWTDVDGTATLLEKMLPELELEQALLRGAYSKPVAWMEYNGLPLSPLYRRVDEYRGALRLEIAKQLEASHGYGVYEIRGKREPRPVFKQRGFDALIDRLGLVEDWPTTSRGHFQTADKDVFRRMAKLHPELEPLRQARNSIRALSLFGSRVGADGRNRVKVWPFGTVTGRNNPQSSQFILSRPHWVRNLVAPSEGRALVHVDIVAAEIGIAADASGDAELIRIYNSGLDPYIEFAKCAGALPPDVVRDKDNRSDIEQIRGLYKVADLAIKYGIGGPKLAANLGIPLWQADRIIASHKRTYATYWAWAEAQIVQAYRLGYISTAFGWQMSVSRDTARNTILNFPQQAACAELMRLTCSLLEERDLGPTLCATHHDAFYLECPEQDAESVSEELRSCFREATEIVLQGRVLMRLDVKTVRHPGHYEDKDGKELWDIVTSYLAQKTIGVSAAARD